MCDIASTSTRRLYFAQIIHTHIHARAHTLHTQASAHSKFRKESWLCSESISLYQFALISRITRPHVQRSNATRSLSFPLAHIASSLTSSSSSTSFGIPSSSFLKRAIPRINILNARLLLRSYGAYAEYQLCLGSMQ